MRSIMLLLSATTAACFAQPDYAGARATSGSVETAPAAPTTAGEWSAAEAAAAISAKGAGTEVLTAPDHITTRGMYAEHKFAVQGGRCYAAGLGWAHPGESAASVLFQPRADGQPVNDSVGGARERLTGTSGVLKFCADRDGEASLTVSKLNADGSMATNTVYELAFVLGSHAETAPETAKRRAVDSDRGHAARGRMDANIADARAREARALEDRCTRCRDDFRLCQVRSAAQHISSRGCDRPFFVCATGKYSGTPEEMAQCGEVPR